MNVNDLILELNNLAFEQKKMFLESIKIWENLESYKKEYLEKSLNIIDEDTTSTTMDLNSNNETKINDNFETFVSDLPSGLIITVSVRCIINCVNKHRGNNDDILRCANNCY